MEDRRCPISEQTPEEEILNVITHGAGFLLASLACLHVWNQHIANAPLFEKTVLIVYFLTWIVLFATSTLYHASRHLGRKAQLRMLDHCAIFVVIAGSYGPYIIHILNDSWGFSIWFLSWLIALLGCLFKVKSRYRYHAQSTWFYILQGWMVTTCTKALIAGLTTAGWLWMVFGGLCMTFGVPFYLRDDIRYNHCVWHVTVVLSGLGFFMSILEFLPHY